MLHKGLTLMAALGLVSASAPSAQADLCFHYGSGGGTLVARGAVPPNPDECKTLAFYEEGGLAGAATGSICMDPQGNFVSFHYTYHSCLRPTYFETGTCHFDVGHDLPASGICRLTFNQTSVMDADQTPVLELCDKPAIGFPPANCL